MAKRVVGYDLARVLAGFRMVVVHFKAVMHAGERSPVPVRLAGQSLGFSLAASAACCVADVVFAYYCRKRFERRPLEAITKVLTEPRNRYRSARR